MRFVHTLGGYGCFCLLRSDLLATDYLEDWQDGSVVKGLAANLAA